MRRILAAVVLALWPTLAVAQNPVSLQQLRTTTVDVNSGVKTNGTLRVVLATDQPSNTNAWLVTGIGGTFPATQSGTWTVQPGNTANTTAWLVTGTGGTFPSTQSGTWTVQPGNTANTTAWLVTGTGGTFPATQSGTWNINDISGTISLPTLAATSTKQSDGSQKTQIVDGGGNVIGATANALNVNISSGNPTTISATQGTSPWIVAGGGTAGTAATGVVTVQGIASMTPVQVSQATASNLNATVVQGTATSLKTQAENYQGGAAVGAANPLEVSLANTAANATAVKVDGSAVTQPISAASLPLPTGASTAAKQPALGTAGTASADVITVQGVASMTPLLVNGSGVTQPVSGTVTAIQGTATSLKTQAEAYQGGAAVAAGNPLQVTLANTGANATAVKVDGSAVTQPVSGTVTVTQATGTNLHAVLDSGTTTVTQGTATSLKAEVIGAGTAGTANAGVLTVQGIASMTPVQVSQATATSLKAEVIGAGTAGTANAGVLTVQGIASMTKLLVTPDANSAVNVAQINGVTTTMGNGVSGTGVQRVTVASDSTGVVGLNTGTNSIGYVNYKPIYGSKTTITWTGTSLANGSSRESTVVNLTSTVAKDVRIRIQSKGQAGGTNYINWYVYTALGDTTYTCTATGTDAAFTTANTAFGCRFLGALKLNAATTATQTEFQLSDIFATVPDKWGLVGDNETGAALSATAGDHVIEYQIIN